MTRTHILSRKGGKKGGGTNTGKKEVTTRRRRVRPTLRKVEKSGESQEFSTLSGIVEGYWGEKRRMTKRMSP